MSIATRPISALPAGTAFSRYCMVLGAGRGDMGTELLLAERFSDSPHVKATLDLRTKAAVAPGTTTDATWASPLAAYGIATEALTLIRGASVLGALEPRFRRVPFRTQVPRVTGSGTGGAWVGQGLSTPVAATAYDTLSQPAYKAQQIVVLSRELLKLSDPAAERTVRETVAAGVAAYLDAQLLTNTVTLSPDLRPAAITNGATAITSTGSTAAQMTADLSALLAAITTGGSGLVWVMRPLTAYKMAATIGGTAAADIPRTLFGIPLVLSENSPQQVTLVDCGHVFYSDDGAIDIQTTDEASIQMNDAPTDPAVAATVFVPLWSSNMWALKVSRWIAYLRAQTGAVAYMTVAY